MIYYVPFFSKKEKIISPIQDISCRLFVKTVGWACVSLWMFVLEYRETSMRYSDIPQEDYDRGRSTSFRTLIFPVLYLPASESPLSADQK
jgi:hypothetical protein